jgi:hypothetical protein
MNNFLHLVSMLLDFESPGSCSDRPTDFESPQQEGRLSPDSRNLANYEDYIRRELPRLVRSNIEEVVRREMQPFEASLVGNLVNIIQDCQDRVFRSYREHEMSSNEDLDLSDNAAATPHPQTDDLGQMNRPGDEAEPTSDFLNSIFQPTPAATGLPERYVADPHLFNLFEDPNHLVPSDSGYGSEQLCNCPGLCSCSASGSSGQMRDARNGQARQDGNISWEEQDWCLYPAWNQNDLMDAELHWEGGD